FVYPGTAEILLNGNPVQNIAYVPVDTLVTGKLVTTRFSLSVPGDRMVEGKNQIELKFVNNLSETQKIHFAMQMASDKLALKSVVPLETVVYNTDDRWKTTFKPAEDQEQVQSNAVLAANFKIPNASIMDMEETQAKAIWVPETEDIRINDAVFEMEFVVDSEFRSGHMFFVAPDDATVLLNDVAIIEDNFFDYDPEPLTVYASRYDFLADQIKPGKNTIKFIVSNKTDFRGFLAEISITKTQKEVN
ncbi:MAG: hypothetical protein PHI68_08835, partial [Candidatus Cloacimonetes bacterium]|nr:hypothetical protein [Candidatus Cloacimonadota bacterium]